MKNPYEDTQSATHKLFLLSSSNSRETFQIVLLRQLCQMSTQNCCFTKLFQGSKVQLKASSTRLQAKQSQQVFENFLTKFKSSTCSIGASRKFSLEFRNYFFNCRYKLMNTICRFLQVVIPAILCYKFFFPSSPVCSTILAMQLSVFCFTFKLPTGLVKNREVFRKPPPLKWLCKLQGRDSNRKLLCFYKAASVSNKNFINKTSQSPRDKQLQGSDKYSGEFVKSSEQSAAQGLCCSLALVYF